MTRGFPPALVGLLVSLLLAGAVALLRRAWSTPQMTVHWMSKLPSRIGVNQV